jgi:hypothetical protein
MSAVPAAAPAATQLDDLSGELERALSRFRGTDCRIASIARRPSAYRTSFALEEVDVVLGDGVTLHLVVKDINRRSLTERARRAKPTFLADPRREIDAYLGILMPADLGTPICYGASVDLVAGRSWLFLERVAGVELYQVGDRAIWTQVASWLAGFHAHFADAGAPLSARTASPFLVYDRDFYSLWPRRALKFAQTRSTELSRSIAWLVERYEPVVERLASLPTTLIHGEFYASNILVHETGERLRISPVDWEMTAIGPGLFDLAALTAGSWSEEERRGFARSYHEALTVDDGARLPFDELLTDLMYCRLHLAVQWLGWAAGWTPPREHTHDWLGEAIWLAKELRL